jgi:hypothetical protein
LLMLFNSFSKISKRVSKIIKSFKIIFINSYSSTTIIFFSTSFINFLCSSFIGIKKLSSLLINPN